MAPLHPPRTAPILSGEGRLAAITGGAGFIGQHLARRLQAAGYRIRTIDLAPPPATTPHVGEHQLADIRDAEAMRLALRDADLVVHTAAVVREDGPRALFRDVNVGGTVRTLDAAISAGATTFVHLSSIMVYGFDPPPFVTEEGPLRGNGNPYCDTKIESELEVRAREGRGGLRTLIVRPGDVYGPGSQPWVDRPIALMRAGLFALPDGGRGTLNHVHVENLVDGILLAIARGTGGREWTLTDGVPTTCRDYFDRLSHAARLPPPRRAPVRALRTALAAAEAIGHLVGRPLPVSASGVDFLLRCGPCSIERARRELGFVPHKDLTTGMTELAESLARTPA